MDSVRRRFHSYLSISLSAAADHVETPDLQVLRSVVRGRCLIYCRVSSVLGLFAFISATIVSNDQLPHVQEI